MWGWDHTFDFHLLFGYRSYYVLHISYEIFFDSRILQMTDGYLRCLCVGTLDSPFSSDQEISVSLMRWLILFLRPFPAVGREEPKSQNEE